MGAKVSAEQQEDLGILAIAALRYAAGRENTTSPVSICGAVAHIVPLLSDTDKRMLMWEADRAITSTGGKEPEWVELMIVLRRVDRP